MLLGIIHKADIKVNRTGNPRHLPRIRILQHLIFVWEGKGGAVVCIPLIILGKALQVNTQDHPSCVRVNHRVITRRLNCFAECNADISPQIARQIIRARIVSRYHLGIKDNRISNFVIFDMLQHHVRFLDRLLNCNRLREKVNADINSRLVRRRNIRLNQYFVLELAEEKMSFSAVVYTSQGEYLGEIAGEIAAVDRDIVLKNVKFGAYV